MGNVEKWVVLGVLALIVGILVISLNVDAPLKGDPASLANLPEEPRKTEKLDPSVQPLLSSNVDTAAAPAPAQAPDRIVEKPGAAVSPSAPVLPAGSILKTTEGLQESYMSDAMFYTWKSGDTFPALAQRFYADPSRLATLKRLNEGRTEVQPGERVLIPIFDLDRPATTEPPALASRSEPTASAASSAPPPAPGTPRIHVVKEGESLWKIAKQELGSGARWNEIYAANRDVLSSPEALHTGLKLRVPE